MQVPSQTYYPLRFPSDKPSESQILQLHKDFQNKNQNFHHIHFSRPSLPPRPDLKQPHSRPSSSKQTKRTTSVLSDDHLQQIQRLEDKLQRVLREALSMAEVLADNQISMALHEKTQERARTLDPRLIQQQYNTLRNKLYVINCLPNTHKLHTHLPNRVSNPQNLLQKPKPTKTLRLHRTIDVKLAPSLRTSASKSVERNKLPHTMRQSDINRAHEGERSGTAQTQQFQALKKKIEHYRHKANKCENAVSELMQVNEAIHQLNEQVNAENIKLRSELLNAKYQRAY